MNVQMRIIENAGTTAKAGIFSVGISLLEMDTVFQTSPIQYRTTMIKLSVRVTGGMPRNVVDKF